MGRLFRFAGTVPHFLDKGRAGRRAGDAERRSMP